MISTGTINLQQWNFGKEINDKSIALLLRWLSPSQLQSFHDYGYIVVIGSDTKRIYRLNTARYSFNICEITGSGLRIKSYCLMLGITPYVFPPADTLLAQKIALENYEKEALKVANVDHHYGPLLTFIKRKFSRFF